LAALRVDRHRDKVTFNDWMHLEMSFKGKYSSNIAENSVQDRLDYNF